MKLKDICLLKVGDTVVVNKHERTVKEPAKNGTINVGNKNRYYSEVQTIEDYRNKERHNNYRTYEFKDKTVL